MSIPSFVPTWHRPKNRCDSTMSDKFKRSLRQLDKLQMTTLKLALLLLLALVLFGCGTPVVVRESCPEYPLPPPELMQPPKLEPLIPDSVKPISTRALQMQRN